MEKKNRILAILYRLYSGNEVSVTELSEEYQVARKSISRDISIIRSFLADHRELVGNVELLYDRKKHSYVLSAGGEYVLSGKGTSHHSKNIIGKQGI